MADEPIVPDTPATLPTTIVSTPPADPPATPPVSADPPAAPPATPDPAAVTPPAAGDWRTKLAGEDKDFAKVLARYTDEAAFGQAHRALQAKLSSGEYKKALPETATPEEKATWRKENGLPEAADGYFEKMALPNGVVLGEADKPIISEFAAAALEANVTPAQLSTLVAKHYALLDAQRVAQEDADANFKRTSEDALRADWQGPDFRRNLTAVSNLMAKWPEGLADRVLAGRTPDGRKLGDDPHFIKQLASLALELNPFSTLVPAGTSDPVKSGQSRLEEIREMRRNNDPKYTENVKKIEAEEMELLDAQIKMKSRAA